MSETVLAHLASALEMVVMEQLPGGTFVQLGDAPPPAWFDRIYRNAGPGSRPTIAQAFPVLATFLSDAESFWQSHATGRLECGDVEIMETSGAQLPVSATAVAMNGRRFLVIQRAPGFEDRQRVLQRAREQTLTHEGLIRELQSLRRPLAALVRLAGELAGTELSGPQRDQVAGITDHLDVLRRTLDELPMAPEGATPHGR